jgi:phosphopentomutase
LPRAVIIVLDSVGIGGAPDAASYNDAGADTIGNIAERCAAGQADSDQRQGPLKLSWLAQLGLGEACRLAVGRVPPGLELQGPLIGRCGCAAERSSGRDTPSGHWEIAGVPVPFEWGYFPRSIPCFPPGLVDELCRRANLPGILGDRHASGTQIIAEHGEEHTRTGRPICYTSADSVFQIAAHEGTFGLQRLYDVCLVAQELVDPLRIGRVIARPFTGDTPETFQRTGNRRDFSTPPPAATILDIATEAGRDVITVGKVADIFAHSGTGRALKATGNRHLFERTVEGLCELRDGGLLFANYIDFDTLYGHRRDVAGYAHALEQLDLRIPSLIAALEGEDLLIVTADHGCDPTWHGTDHTREQVPLLAFGDRIGTGSIGSRETFADVAASVAAHLNLRSPGEGVSFL